jgi:hypothetical protein
VNCEEKRGISISAKFWDRVGQSRTEPDSATAGWSGFNLELCWLGLGELLQATAGGAADFANELVDKEELDGSRKSVTKNHEN